MHIDSKKSLIKTHEKFMDICVRSIKDEDIDKMVIPEIMGFGTAKDETILNIQALKKLLELQSKQSDGWNVNYEISPVFNKINDPKNAAIIVDLINVSMSRADLHHNLLLRVTTYYENIEDQWKVVHWHTSIPQENTSEDTWHIDEWKRKTEELQKLVDEKTSQLTNQNKELEIEAALERVRTTAMSMQKPEDLSMICEKIFVEMKSLGFQDLRNTEIILNQGEKELIRSYYFSDYGVTGIVDVDCKTHPLILQWFYDLQKQQDAFAEVTISRDQMEEWEEYRQSLGYVPDSKLNQAEEVYYYSYATGSGALSISSFTSLSKVDIEVMKRFRNVFNLAYQRYLDIHLAEQQAREAQVEVALEKVRSHSLAVTKTDEFNEVVKVVFEKLGDLQIPASSVTIVTSIENSKDHIIYGCGEGEAGLATVRFHIPYFPNVFIDDLLQEKSRKASGFWRKVYAEEDKNHYYKYAFEHTELKHLPEDLKEQVWKSKSYGLSTAYSRNSAIMVNDFNGNILDEDQSDILRRFSRVFEQAYIRFLDLKKAEAQAREAQIELSLERIRAQVTSMQESSDLFDIVVSMRNEFIALDHEADYFWHMRWSTDNYEMSMTSTDGSRLGMVITVPKFVHEQIEHLHQWENGDSPYFVLDLDAEGAWDYIDKMNTYGHYEQMDPHAPTEEDIYQIGGLTFIIARTTHGEIGFSLAGKVPDPPQESIDTLVRFAGVFDLAYRRFEDLKAKERQHREAQIELALERVRARTMAMQHSDELPDVANVLFLQVQALGIPAWSAGYNILSENKEISTCIMSSEGQVQAAFQLPLTEEKSFQEWHQAIINKKEFFIQELGGQALEEHYTYLTALPDIQAAIEPLEEAGISLPTYQINHLCLFNQGFLLFITYEKVPDAHEIFRRFTQVFEQTYTRFLDLQKAEEQARKAQVEVAVEKVRAKALAMHNSKEILEVVARLRDEMLGLEIPGVVAATIYLEEEEGSIRMWDLSSVQKLEEGFQVTLDVQFKLEETHPELYIRKVWNNDARYFIEHQEAKDMSITLDWLRQYNPEQADEVEKFLKANPWKILYHPTIQLANGKMSVDILDEKPPEEMESILIKMGAAFDLAYKRYQDLQKKEAQLREAQIEAALEKVRSRTMAMHKPEELKEVVLIVVEKLMDLGVILDANGVVLCTYFPDSKNILHWIASPDFSFAGSYLLPYFDHPILKVAWASRLSGDEYFSQSFSVEEKNSFYEHAFEHSDYKYFPDEFKEWIFQNDQHSLSFAWTDNAAILIPSHTGVVPEGEDVEILKRFARVFEQAYVRFMDLQKAEKAARETQIELSLEKIRSQVTSMQESADLLEIMVSIRKEFVDLGHEAHYFWYMRWLPDIYEKAMTSGDGTHIGMVMKLPRHIHGDIPILAEWEKSNVASVVYPMDIEAALDYVHKMVSLGDFVQIDPNAPTDDDIRHIGGLTFIMARTTQGEIGYSLPGEVPNPPQEAIDTLVRFAGVFDLAYRRFEDLKESEKQKQEAEIELALERVRSKAMSMEHSGQLYEVVNELRNQMGILGQKELELCMVHFYDKYEDYFESWGAIPTSDGDGKYFQGTAKYPKKGIKVVEEMMVGYHSDQQEYTIINENEKAKEWFELMQKYSPEAYQALMHFSQDEKGIIPSRAYWTFADFEGGSLGMVTYSPPDEASKDLLVRSAAAFGIAYTRFQDLQVKEVQAKRLHEEKQRLEKTLNELKSTQAQLIQSEKMASLGELTAGIAHEIQNPLNFVNNFSEVSEELIDEMQEEIENGDMDEVKAISNDLKENLGKIHQHGKRAESIVKGMLLHSRTTKGEKVPTDMNALCDEFLRLSYHGLRAKDRSFNADFEVEFDETIPKIEVIPQDMGRVLLNLINNAFQAVSQNRKPLQGLEALEGINGVVKVTTKNRGDNVQISVSDNGPGIPDDIKDKIFQPFFTTKPTGQGTGLGLSLAYDIVKAHGGEISVQNLPEKSKSEDRITVFVVRLPI